MAKVEQITKKSDDGKSPKKSNKKRKNKDVIDAVESSSGKFKKIGQYYFEIISFFFVLPYNILSIYRHQ